MNYLLIGALAFGLMFGGIGGAKLSKLNPFKGRAGIVQKAEQSKEEYFKDKIKGIEYKSKESSKAQNSQMSAKVTIGSKIGNFIDGSIQLIMFVLIGGVILFFATGINIFKRIKVLTLKANKYRRALKQTVKAIDNAKPKLNGTNELLKAELAKSHDEDTKIIVNELKNE